MILTIKKGGDYKEVNNSMTIKFYLFLEEFEEITNEVNNNLIEKDEPKANSYYFMFFFFLLSFLQQLLPIRLWNNLLHFFFKEYYESTVKNNILYLTPDYITPNFIFPLEGISEVIEDLSKAPHGIEIYIDASNELVIEPIYWYQKLYALIKIAPNPFLLGQYNLMKKLYLSHQIGLLNTNDYDSLRLFNKKFHHYKKYRILNNFIVALYNMNVRGMQKQLNLFFKKNISKMVSPLFSHAEETINAKRKSITRFGENLEYIQTVCLTSKKYEQLLLNLYLYNILEPSHPNNNLILNFYNDLYKIKLIRDNAALFSLFIATIDVFAQNLELQKSNKYAVSAYELIFKALQQKLINCNEINRKRYYISCIKTKRFNEIALKEIFSVKDYLTPTDYLEIGNYLYTSNVESFFTFPKNKNPVDFKTVIAFYSVAKIHFKESFLSNYQEKLDHCISKLTFTDVCSLKSSEQIELYLESLYNSRKFDLIIKITDNLFKRDPQLLSKNSIKFQMLAHAHQSQFPITTSEKMLTTWIQLWVDTYKISSDSIPAICWNKSAEIYRKKNELEVSRAHFVQAGVMRNIEKNLIASKIAFENALDISMTLGEIYTEKSSYNNAIYNFNYAIRIIDDYLAEKQVAKKLAYFYKIRITFEQLKYPYRFTENEIKRHKINNKETIDNLKDLLQNAIKTMFQDDPLYSAECYFLLAEVYRYSDLDGINQESMAKQIENYSKAIDYQPDNVYYLMALAKSYTLCNFNDKAEEIFKKIETFVVNFHLDGYPLNKLYEYLNENFLQKRVKSLPRSDWDLVQSAPYRKKTNVF